jgi:anti-sigma-K factor RskA
MTADHEAVRDLAVGYAFGTLDAAERHAFESHLRTCAECQQDVRDAALLAEGLARIVDSQAPPAGLKERVRSVTTAAAPLPQNPVEAAAPARTSMLPTWLAIAASIVAIVAVGAAWNLSRQAAATLADANRESAAALAESSRQSAAALAEANRQAASAVAEANRQAASAQTESGRQSAASAEASRRSAAALTEANRQAAAALARAEEQSAALAEANRQSAAALAEVERRSAAAVAEANRQTASATSAQAEAERQRQLAGTAQQALVREQASAAEARREIEIATAPDVKRVDLAGQPAAPRAAGRVFWSPSRGLLFTAANLPPLPPGRVYQLWYVTAAAPVSAGLVSPDASGQSRTLTPSRAPVQPKAFALTIEPDGGVPAPTGAFYLLGSL